MSDPQRDPSLLHEDVEDVDDRPVVVLRRSALAQAVLLFCVAFTAGAVLFQLARVLGEASLGDVWAESLSDGMLLSGLVAGELFILWNNGWRQGVRGHSIGKHREGLRVVDIRTRRPTGPWRGLARGLVMAVLLDLAVAAIPIGLPTVLRRFTPDAWHVGASAYLALIVLVVPLLMRSDRGFADRAQPQRADGDAELGTRHHLRHLLYRPQRHTAHPGALLGQGLDLAAASRDERELGPDEEGVGCQQHHRQQHTAEITHRDHRPRRRSARRAG